MENSTVLGTNRTGVDMSPIDIKEMTALTNVTLPSSPGDERAIARMRGKYIAEADTLGSIPPPGTLKGVATTAMQKLTGRNPEARMTSGVAPTTTKSRSLIGRPSNSSRTEPPTR